MAKQFNEKLRTIKDLVSGKKTIQDLRPPQYYCVICSPDEQGEKQYEVNNKTFNQQDYDIWLKSVRAEDTVIHFIEIRDYSEGKSAPVVNKSPILVPVEVKVVKEAVEPHVKEIPRPAINARKEAVIAPQLRPYSEHIKFNKRIINKLFS